MSLFGYESSESWQSDAVVPSFPEEANIKRAATKDCESDFLPRKLLAREVPRRPRSSIMFDTTCMYAGRRAKVRRRWRADKRKEDGKRAEGSKSRGRCQVAMLERAREDGVDLGQKKRYESAGNLAV